MEAKHTQGPWHVGMRSGANSNIIYARDGETEFDDNTICSVYRMFQHCEIEEQRDSVGVANARLIAAAPELLEALKKLRSAFIVHTNWNGDPLAEVADANRVIAKAQPQEGGEA